MRTAEFDFELPQELIAQTPAPLRDQSRLLVLDRASQSIEHRRFDGLLNYLRPGDALILNNSRVISARLRGINTRTGGAFEILLLEENSVNDWWVMLRPGKRGRVGTQITLLDPQRQASEIHAVVLETNAEGHRRLRFSGATDVSEILEAFGEVPLPPYISRPGHWRQQEDRERYQTVFAEPPGSVAAPTAGLHFTEGLLNRIRSIGVQVGFLTLHVGLGTFAPVKAADLAAHQMHEERFQVVEDTVSLIRQTKERGGRVVAVGTTTVRVLETLAEQIRDIRPGCGTIKGKTAIFIYPPYSFKIVDALVTNFHLPRSTLLMLVSGFAQPGGTEGRDLVLRAYGEAIAQRYRFFSYGDAMLLL